MIIGADESGTGAWAGPFTVCAFAIDDEQQELLTKLGARDSKKMTDRRRREVMEELIGVARVVCLETVLPSGLNLGKTPAWQNAMFNAITNAHRVVGHATVIIDGNKDLKLERRLSKFDLRVLFMTQADNTIPAVSAASVVAKTLRNDMMIKLHKEYPEYGWNENAGYGSPAHQVALEKYGKTVHHRPWKNLIGIPMRQD